MDTKIIAATEYLKARFYHFPDGWVEACLEFLSEEHRENQKNFNNNHWCRLIEEQWLFTDLRELDTSSGIVLRNKVEKFSAVLCFQVNKCINISKSFYSQIQEINGTVNQNILVTAEPTQPNTQIDNESTRTLLLELTDGVSDFTALEFKPWPHIKSSDLVGGSKIRLKGPFIIRNKIALLRKENIEFIRGEVEELKSMDATDILAQKLCENLQKSKISFNKNCLNNPVKKKEQPTIIQSIQYPQASIVDTNQNESSQFITNTTNQNERLTNETREFRQTNLESWANKNKIQQTNEIRGFQTTNDIRGFQTTNQNQFGSLSKDIPGYSIVNTNSRIESNDVSSSLFDNEALFDDGNSTEIEDEEMMMMIDEELDELVNDDNIVDDTDEPFTYISKMLKDCSDGIIKDSYFIRGIIMKFVTKLSIENGQYKVYVTMHDGANCVDCRVGSDIVEKEIGMNINRAQQIKKEGPEAKKQFREGVIRFQKNISGSYKGIFCIRIDREAEEFIIESYRDFKIQDCEIMQKRIRKMYPE